jgi:hypothetical protein
VPTDRTFGRHRQPRGATPNRRPALRIVGSQLEERTAHTPPAQAQGGPPDPGAQAAHAAPSADPTAPDEAAAPAYTEHVIRLGLVLRYPETWDSFHGRYLRAVETALARLQAQGWQPDGAVDWETMHAGGRLWEAGALIGAVPTRAGAAGGRFGPVYVCDAVTVRLRRTDGSAGDRCIADPVATKPEVL